jgi:trk system potassium uptake protein TrkH
MCAPNTDGSDHVDLPDQQMKRPSSIFLRVWQLFDPSELFVLSFAAAILAGAFGLMLPVSRTGGLNFIDALFTSTSAVCVTGLASVDIGTTFTRTGLVLVLGLIQAGGLGIMTFSVLLAVVTRRRLSLRNRLILQDSLATHAPGETLPLVKRIFLITAAVELGGAVLLLVSTPEHRPFESLFHAVSAFCNAGFSPRPNNLMDYRYNIVVNLAISTLIVVGGLGFASVVDLLRFVRTRGGFRASLHSRLVWRMTILLLLSGTVGFAFLEWRNILQGEGARGIVLVSVFQSVTPRTAGFNTVDFGQLSNATLFVAILLMFVGGSPGSTAGGIKTTSLGVLLGLAKSRLMGSEHVSISHRTVPASTVSKAISVTVLAFAMVTLATLVMSVTEMGSQPFGSSDIRFIEMMFEVVSAFATVGLSTGVTPRLSSLGKLILILLMFIGRVGPLTLATVVGRSEARGKFRYSEETVMIG